MNDFRGKKAWFSTSVDKECRQVWEKGGGKIVKDIKHANYIFADDPSVSDISRFYKSKLFLNKVIQPFKSAWLLQTNQCIFDFILYPEDFKETTFMEDWVFEDEGSSPTFYSLKDFRNGCSQRSESTACLDDDDVSSPPNHLRLKNNPEKKCTRCHDLLEPKSPMPVQNALTLEKERTRMCQLESSSSVFPSQNPKTDSERKGQESSLQQNQNSEKIHNEVKEFTEYNKEDFDKVDASSVVSIAEETDVTMLLPTSVTLHELEIPNHVFHSSMHDGFTRIEDIEIPEALKLQDFFCESDEEEAEYQVYLKCPPSKTADKT